MGPSQARIVGQIWFAPIGTPLFNAFDDQGNPVTLSEDGVTPWQPLVPVRKQP